MPDPTAAELIALIREETEEGGNTADRVADALAAVAAEALPLASRAADVNPARTSIALALGAKADLVGGKVPSTQIPSIAITAYLGVVASEGAMLALTGEFGDWCVRSDLGKVAIITGETPSEVASWTLLTYPAAQLSADQLAGIQGSTTPLTELNPVASQADLEGLGGGFVVKTEAFTTANGGRYACDVTAGGFPVTLHATPADGDHIEIVPAKGTFAVNNLTIEPGAESIDGGVAGTDLILSGTTGVLLVYRVGYGWEALIAGVDTNRFGGINENRVLSVGWNPRDTDLLSEAHAGDVIIKGLLSTGRGPAIIAAGWGNGWSDILFNGQTILLGQSVVPSGLTAVRIYWPDQSLTVYGNIYANACQEFLAVSSLGTPGADSIRISAKLVGDPAYAEAFVVDEQGNETQFSPHDPTAPAHLIDSPFDEINVVYNAFTGLIVRTNKARLAAGRTDAICWESYEDHNARTGASETTKDWATEQGKLVAARDAERLAWAERKTAWEADPAHAEQPFAETEPAALQAKACPQFIVDQLAGKEALLASMEALTDPRRAMVLTYGQFWELLIRAGLDEAVTAWAMNIPDAVERKVTQHWLQNSEFRRLHPRIVATMSLFGVTDEQADAMFQAAMAY